MWKSCNIITVVNSLLTGIKLLYDVALVNSNVEDMIQNSKTPNSLTSWSFAEQLRLFSVVTCSSNE